MNEYVTVLLESKIKLLKMIGEKYLLSKPFYDIGYSVRRLVR